MIRNSSWRSKGLPALVPGCLIAGLCLTGCLQPEPTGPSGQNPNAKELEEPVLLAGASSSTNWPVTTKSDSPIEIKGTADSVLSLSFSQFDTATLQFVPFKLKGVISLMPGSAIPALNPVRTIRWSFPEAESLNVPLHLLDSLFESGKDSINFTLRVDSDTIQSLLVGFGYSKNRKIFYKSPFSTTSPIPLQLFSPHFYYNGEIDTATLRAKIPGYLNFEMSFYIPGTLFHWKTQLTNPLSIGPLSSGTYPLQLIVVMPLGVNGAESQVEIFEVVVKLVSPAKPHLFQIGDRLLSRKFPGPITLLPNNP